MSRLRPYLPWIRLAPMPATALTGPVSSTDNAIVRWDGTGGIAIQDSVVTIADTTGNMAGVGTVNTHTIPGGTDTFCLIAATQTLSGKTLTAPKFASGGFIADSSGNEQMVFTLVGSAITYVNITNAITGITGPIIAAAGESNVDLRIAAAGTGAIHTTSGAYGDLTNYTPSAAGTATLTLNTSNIHTITMPAGNITIAISNASVGQVFTIRILQDSGGSRTVAWFTTIKWAGGSAPTLTTTAAKADTFTFVVTSAGNYDGYVVGQNV